MSKNWKHKDLWTLRGKDFAIEVSRHSVATMAPNEGINRWCVYAYIHPTNPYFSKFEGDDYWQDATQCMPFHGGCTYLEYITRGGKVTCIKVGADYSHYRDDHFYHYATKDDAWEVFSDAEELFLVLSHIEGDKHD